MQKIISIPTIIIVVSVITADSALALQSHGPPEGIYVHQMAHMLFTGALLYLYWHTRHTAGLEGKGWKYLQIFCIVFAFWNLVAFVGHEVLRFLEPEDFVEINGVKERIAGPLSFIKLVYFLTKMDHLLYVPALLALVISLRSFYKDALQEEEQ